MEPEILDHTDDIETKRKSKIGVASSSSSSSEEDGNSIINTSNGIQSPETGTSGQCTGKDHHHEQQPRRTENSDDHVIDVYDDSGEDNKICRICHLSAEPSSGLTGLMELGCHCKAELSICHQRCAETWFKHKGNSVCEVCGVRAKNVKLVKNYNSRMFIVDYDDIRPVTGVAQEEGSRWCKQSCCNFLLACLVLGLVVPWFLKTHLF